MLFNVNVQLLEYTHQNYTTGISKLPILNEKQGVLATDPRLLDLSYRDRAIVIADMYWGNIRRNDTIVNSDAIHENPHCICISVGQDFTTIVIVTGLPDFE